MSIQVHAFNHIPGVNDAEYIRLLKEHLEAQTRLTNKAIAKIKEQASIIEQYKKADTFLAVHGWKWE